MQNISNDNKQRFGAAAVVFARRWRQMLDQRLLASGLSDASWTPLIYLFRLGDGVLQRELAAAAGLDDSSLVRHLDILVTSGLLERKVDPNDRRGRRLYLTKLGRERARDVQAKLHAIENEMLVGVAESDIAIAMSLFEMVERRLEDMRLAEASL